MKNPIKYCIFKTKFGPMAMICTANSIQNVYLPFKTIRLLRKAIQRDYPQSIDTPDSSLPKWVLILRQKLIKHIEGSVQRYDKVKIDLGKLTPFQIKVLNLTSRIPVGKTLTYKQVADQINHPKSYRAVGHALSQNPLPLIIPCHRVIASNGIGGFSAESGVSLKKYLLKLENLNL